MSYFDSCGECGIDFPKRQYVFAMCEPCLLKIKCYKCQKFLTMDDHRKSTSELCFSCDQDYETYKPLAIESKYSKLSDENLEKAWQSSANEIGMYAQKSWNCPKEDEQKFRDLAEKAQKEQGEIQKEITRRH